MIKNFTRASLLALALTSMSCASIIHGSTQIIDFNSQPAGATITIDGKTYGETPMAIPLKRNGRLSGQPDGKTMYAVTISMDGYYPYDIKLKRELDGWFFGNIIFGGLIGIIVDAASGSMYKLTPDQVIAQMSQLTAGKSGRNDQHIYVAVAMQIDPAWEKIGQLEKK
jgi:hypothetical protein